MKANSQKIASLELMRIIAMIAIIAIHTRIFIAGPLLQGQPWLADIINQLSRFAVPFFFLLSGFLIQPKLCLAPILTMRRYCVPLLKIWLVWSVICLLLPTQYKTLMSEGYLSERQDYLAFLLKTPLNSALEGGFVHLWFLPALMIAVCMIAFFVYFKQLRYLLPFSILLYVVGVLAGSYASLTEMIAPFMTRNGPFFSLLMVAIGFEIKRCDLKLSTSLSLLLLCLGLIGHFTEAFWLFSKGVSFPNHDFLFFTPLWAVGLFLFLLSKPNLGEHPLTHYLSRLILPIYLCHLSIVVVFYNLIYIFSITGFARDALVFFGTLIMSFIFVKMIEKTPLNKYLFR